MNNYNMGPMGNQPNYWQHDTRDSRDIMSKCSQYMNYHVIGHLSDGTNIDGIIEDMDDDGVTMLMPEEVDDDTDGRQYGGYGGYGGGYRRRFRRFRRRRFPYSAFIFPFIIPFPYYYPYY